jgi:hypothetical protein
MSDVFDTGGREAAELRRRREALVRRVDEAQWDLGGLTYEMAARDHFKLDVLTARAADLQELDNELATLDRSLALHEGGAGGVCRACGALHVRDALYCSQCGTELARA